jgi:hypothetical protein
MGGATSAVGFTFAADGDVPAVAPDATRLTPAIIAPTSQSARFRM